MTATEFARWGLCALLGVLGFAGAALIAVYVIGFIVNVLAVILIRSRRDDDHE